MGQALDWAVLACHVPDAEEMDGEIRQVLLSLETFVA
jgi:hypothetical protein